MVIGLTGGISCGKTTVAKVFKDLGAYVIDVDSLGHYLLENDPEVYREIVRRFGTEILKDDGKIDRAKLGRIVFSDASALRTLNAIVHPPLIELTKSRVKWALEDGNDIVVIDAALLIELNLMDTVDLVILVCSDEEKQIERLVQKGLTKDEALSRVRAQLPTCEKVRFADFIIYNNGSLEELYNQSKEVWNKVVRSEKKRTTAQ